MLDFLFIIFHPFHLPNYQRINLSMTVSDGICQGI